MQNQFKIPIYRFFKYFSFFNLAFFKKNNKKIKKQQKMLFFTIFIDYFKRSIILYIASAELKFAGTMSAGET